MDIPRCTCGHAWFWHDARGPSKCDYGDCTCRQFKDDGKGEAEQTTRLKPSEKPTTDEQR